jgi:hypothetical protein
VCGGRRFSPLVQTDGQTNKPKLFVASSNFANASKHWGSRQIIFAKYQFILELTVPKVGDYLYINDFIYVMEENIRRIKGIRYK